MSDDIKEVTEELKEEIRSLREEIRREVAEALGKPKGGSISVSLHEDEIAQTEPTSVVVKDLVHMIRDNVRASLAEKGEQAVDKLVKEMPETKAAELLKSLANTERIKIAKMLYSSNVTYSDLKAETKLDSGSVSYHVKSLTDMGLVAHNDEGEYLLTKRGRVLVRTLALMNEALGGEKVD